VNHDAQTPSARASAVLRAAEAAAAAAQGGPRAPDPPPAAPPAHRNGTPAELLAATGELEADLASARAQLDALDGALARLVGGDAAH
jgi:hypothetical protein